jgi:Leucine-rich repeat (LRR) protein
MVNIQELLEQTYPNKITTTEINLNSWKEKQITGVNELVISDYPNLITIKNDSCKNIQKLFLNNLPSLTKLSWTKSELTVLGLRHCPELEMLDCSNNLLTEINFPLDVSKLKKLYLSNNNFAKQDLSAFKDLLNLEELSIGNYRETNLRQISAGDYGESKIKQNIYNRFYGSLEPLKDLTNLNLLEINNTDINSGLEYLRLEDDGKIIVYCLAQERPDCEVKEIWEKLNPYTSDVQAWKKDNPSLIITPLQERLKEVKKELRIEREEFKKFQEKSVEYQQQRENKVKELEQENTQLRQKLMDLQQNQEQLQTHIETNRGQ